MNPKKSRDARALVINTHPVLNNSRPMLNQDENQIDQAFEDEAERRGVAMWELMLQLTSVSEEHLQSQLHAAHRELAEMVEMSWADYCLLHNLAEDAL